MVLAVLLAALAGGGLQSWQQPVYEAAADVAIGHAQPLQAPQVIVLEKGPSDESVASSAALLGLVHQGEVARIVRERLDERLAGTSAVDLLGMIAGDFVTYRGRALSDLIRISARAPTPQDAADLATIWAEEYVASVNRMQRLEQGGGGRSTPCKPNWSPRCRPAHKANGGWRRSWLRTTPGRYGGSCMRTSRLSRRCGRFEETPRTRLPHQWPSPSSKPRTARLAPALRRPTTHGSC